MIDYIGYGTFESIRDAVAPSIEIFTANSLIKLLNHSCFNLLVLRCLKELRVLSVEYETQGVFEIPLN